MNASWSELMFTNTADYTALASSSAEGSLLSGVKDQPVFYPPFFLNKPGFGRSFALRASGVISCTGTPTITWQARLGTTAGSSYLSGTSIGVSAAITMQSGITNQRWEMDLHLVCTSPGIGTTNCTLAGSGKIASPGGFATPFLYDIEPTTPATATWTAAIDGALTQYLQLSATWSASSASNTVTCKQLQLFAWN